MLDVRKNGNGNGAGKREGSDWQSYSGGDCCRPSPEHQNTNL